MNKKRLLIASLMTCMLLGSNTLNAKAYEPSSVMDLLIETTSPTDVSIQVGNKYYNLGPLDYDNAEAINPTSYNRGRITTSYYKWVAAEDGSLALEEASDQSDSDLTITRITNPQHSRQKANLNGGDLTGQIFINQSNNSQNGGAIINSSGFSIGDITSYFVSNHTPKSHGGAIYNDGSISSITGDFIENYVESSSGFGGAISNLNGTIGTIDSNFISNYVYASGDVHGGAIHNASAITSINGDFIYNSSTSENNHSYGGAISNRKGGYISEISGNFIGNYTYNMTGVSTGESDNKDAMGGAISNIQAGTRIDSISGGFVANYAESENNIAKGGAIFNSTNTASIGEIVGGFVGNYAKGDRGAFGGAIHNNTGNDTAAIEYIDGVFKGNYATSASGDALGGAIYNENTTTTATNLAHIGNISGSFESNHADGDIARGGAIYSSKAIIDSIEADFENNYTNSNDESYGGAIFNTNSTIGSIAGRFTNNSSKTDGTLSSGGAIYNLEGTIGDITGSFNSNHTFGDISDSYGGAIYNKDATIGAITGNFEGNISSGSDDSAGGAIFNSGGDITLIDSSFKNNATTGYGGAITNSTNSSAIAPTINIIANSKNVEFTGNKHYANITINDDGTATVTGGYSNSIYNDQGIINLNAKEGQKITFNDYFTGELGVLNINKENSYLTLDSDLNEVLKDIDQIGGDYIFNADVDCNTINLFNNGTITLGSDVYMELDAFTNDDNNGTLDAANGNAEQALLLGATELNSDLNFKMDMDITDMSDIHSDIISVDGTNSYGNIVLSEIKLAGNVKIEDFEEDTEITKRVLFENDEYTTISLGDDVLNNFNTTKTKDLTGSDEWTGPDINWDDEFGGYTITRTIDSAISVIGSEQGLMDTLDWIVTVDESDPVYTDKADNLALVNQYETTDDRHFNFDSTQDEFVVSQDSGTTASGKLVINGVKDDDGNKSTINGTDEEGNRHNLFELTSSDETVVEINNTKITGAGTVATVSDGNTLTLNHVEISGNTNGIINDGNLNLSGNNVIADNISNATGGGVMSVLSGTTTIADGSIVDQNTLQTESGSKFDIAGTVSVADKFNNLGDINIADTGTLNLNGNNLDITGRIVNENQLNINGTAKNSTQIINNGELVINGEFTNVGLIKDINNQGTLTNKSDSFVNNSTIMQKQFKNEGNVDNKGFIIASNIINKDTLSTNSEKLIADTINNSGTLNFTSGAKTVSDITGTSSGDVNLSTGGNFTINNKISDTQLSLNDATLYFGSNADISQAAAFNVNGGGINVADNKLGNINLGKVNLNGKSNLSIDFNLTDLTSDTFDSNIINNGGKFNVTKINFLGSPTIKDSIRIHLGDTTKLGKTNVTSEYFDLPDVMTPIRRLSGNISQGWLTYEGTGNSFKDFNPSVMASPVAALVGGFLTQSQTLQDGFYHMDRYTKYTQNQRMAAENTNKYADATGTPVYTTSSLPETSSAMWVKPYTTFESVDLKNGTGVSNVAYGMLYGGDTDLVDLGRGYKGVISAFVGYNGSHQSYNGIDMNQQGGTLGVTGTLYKGNFFTGLTISTGASGGEAFTAYGTDKFSMLTAGIANKTGYNIEVAQGKLIIQPSIFLGYTFANTFDYTNSADVRIKSNPLNAIQIAPGIKLIGNLENGWQPYLGVDMMWNIMGKTDFTANQTQLPNMSVKPYVQYGAGVQKSWGKRFTAFFQTMLRNGGRTGVILQAGFRWTLGKDTSKTKAKTKKIIK